MSKKGKTIGWITVHVIEIGKNGTIKQGSPVAFAFARFCNSARDKVEPETTRERATSPDVRLSNIVLDTGSQVADN